MGKNYGELFNRYYEKVLEYPNYSREEIEEMMLDSKSGDLDLIDKIVNNYLKVVISVVYKYENQVDKDNIMDVIHCGNLALTKAVKDYNESKNNLDNFLVSSINQAIRSYFKKKSEFDNLTLNNVSKNEIDRDMLLVLKELLETRTYCCFYNVLIGKSFDEIASELGIEERKAMELYSIAYRMYSHYVDKGEEYQKKVCEINKREGKKKEKLRTEPLMLEDVIKFLYLQNVLDDEEMRLYYYQAFGKYKYNISELCRILKLTNFKYIELNNRLKHKIKTYLSSKDFENYKEEMLLKYGDALYELLNDINLKKVNYNEVKKVCASLTLSDVREMLGEDVVLLNADEISLLNKFFGEVEEMYIEPDKVEMDVNLRKFGFNRNNHRILPSKLYDDFLKYKEEFNDEQTLFLECYYFKIKDRDIFRAAYPDSALYYRHDYLISRLERIHYGIYKKLENTFNKDKYLIVKAKYSDRFTKEKLAMLDLYYGVNGRRYTISEIVNMYGYNYSRGHDLISDARDSCISLYTNRCNRLEINKSLYIPYLSEKYEYTSETRKILYMYLVEEKKYDEISSETGLTKYRISNIITDGLRKIDAYRFGLSESKIVGELELNNFLQIYGASFDGIFRSILFKKFVDGLENKDIASLYLAELENALDVKLTHKEALLEVNRIVAKFNKLYISYRVRKVILEENDIVKEINRHDSESFFNDMERKMLSYYFGIKNEYNPKGEKLDFKSISIKMDVTLNIVQHRIYSSIEKMKARKIEILKPDLCFIERDELDKILDDKHLPISDKERKIICHLFGLKGYQCMKFPEIVATLGEGSSSVRRRYYRAIVSIKKYLNEEIDPQLDYDEDIVPLLKYFSLGDREIIEEHFKNGLTYEKLAKKYNLTFEKIVNIMTRIKVNLFDLMDDPDTRKFDFDYYMEAIKDRNLPFYGNIDLAIEIFNLSFGMYGIKRLSVPEIIEQLELSFKPSAINNCINSLMLAVCKLRDGMKKEKEFTFFEIQDYYFRHSHEMNSTHKVYYDRYFARVKKRRELNGIQSKVSEYITYDLVKEQSPDCFKLQTSNRDEVFAMLKNNVRTPIKSDTRKSLMYYYGISYRDLMTGKEINHVYRIIDGLLKQKIIYLKDNEDEKKLQKY